jgi:beta propeller repeat protein
MAGKIFIALFGIMGFVFTIDKQLQADWYVDPGDEFSICTDLNSQGNPAISGDIVVWEDKRHLSWDIYGYDVSAAQELDICTDASEQQNPAIEGPIVVWEDKRPDNTVWHIYGKNLDIHQEFAVSTVNIWDDVEPDIYGNIVVWSGIRTGVDFFTYWGIYGYNISTQQEFPISTVRWVDQQIYKQRPKIFGDVVIWYEFQAGAEHRNVRGKYLSSGVEFTVCSDPSPQGLFDIYGDIVVWEDYSQPGMVDIYGTYISTGEEFPITTNGCSTEPDIYDNFVVWREWYPGFWPAIYCMDLSTGQVFPVTHYPSTKHSPAIFGDLVVWEDERYGNSDIYGNNILLGISGDINRDGIVNLIDFAILASYWLSENCNVGDHCMGADYDSDGDVDGDDLGRLCELWLSSQ